MSKTADLVIIGGGVVGASIAYYLAKMGYQNGYLILARTGEEMDIFRDNVSLQRGLGLNVDLLSPREIKTLIPSLNTHDILS